MWIFLYSLVHHKLAEVIMHILCLVLSYDVELEWYETCVFSREFYSLLAILQWSHPWFLHISCVLICDFYLFLLSCVIDLESFSHDFSSDNYKVLIYLLDSWINLWWSSSWWITMYACQTLVVIVNSPVQLSSYKLGKIIVLLWFLFSYVLCSDSIFCSLML